MRQDSERRDPKEVVGCRPDRRPRVRGSHRPREALPRCGPGLVASAPVPTGAGTCGCPAEAYTMGLPKCLVDPKTESAKGWETGQTFPFFSLFSSERSFGLTACVSILASLGEEKQSSPPS